MIDQRWILFLTNNCGGKRWGYPGWSVQKQMIVWNYVLASEVQRSECCKVGWPGLFPKRRVILRNPLPFPSGAHSGLEEAFWRGRRQGTWGISCARPADLGLLPAQWEWHSHQKHWLLPLSNFCGVCCSLTVVLFLYFCTSAERTLVHDRWHIFLWHLHCFLLGALWQVGSSSPTASFCLVTLSLWGQAALPCSPPPRLSPCPAGNTVQLPCLGTLFLGPRVWCHPCHPHLLLGECSQCTLFGDESLAYTLTDSPRALHRNVHTQAFTIHHWTFLSLVTIFPGIRKPTCTPDSDTN